MISLLIDTDALQNYAAEHSSGIDFVVTRNTKDYKNSLLKVLMPNDFLSQYKDIYNPILQ